jgi:RNA polymerase sigma-70 factor (ECF subfamily)
MDNPPTSSELVNSRLSKISTIWTMLASAHEGTATEAASARLAFVQRYQRAAYRYLLGALHDADAADDLFQEVVLRFVRGDFRQADPEKGRFRDYLKTSLAHLIADHYRQQRRQVAATQLTGDIEQPSTWDQNMADALFAESWRDELFDRAWEKLERDEHNGGPPFYSVLRYRAEHPEVNSSDIALEVTLAKNLQPAMTPENLRKILQRARQRFADHLLDEVTRSLQDSTDESLEQELIELDLLRFCRGAISRRIS